MKNTHSFTVQCVKSVVMDLGSVILFFSFLCACTFNMEVKGFTDEQFELKKYQLECLYDAETDPDHVIWLKGGYWKNPHVSLQKWALCVLVKSGIMSKEGVFYLDEAMNRIPEYKRYDKEKKFDLCLPNRRVLPHEIAWAYLACMNMENPKDFVIL